MITALGTAVWNEGFKPATGEHEVLLAVAALALTDTGPGAPSLDSALGIERSGAGLDAGGPWRRSGRLGDGDLKRTAPGRGVAPRRTGWGARDTGGAAGARGAHELAPYLDTLLIGVG